MVSIAVSLRRSEALGLAVGGPSVQGSARRRRPACPVNQAKLIVQGLAGQQRLPPLRARVLDGG